VNNNSTPFTLHSTLPKPVLLISASDSSSSAGMQVDLRVLDDLGVPARCALTAQTVQGDGGARSINPAAPEVILASIETALSDAPGIGAVKVGLLGNVRTARTLEKPLALIKESGIPIVIDPVMRSTPGSALSIENTAESLLGKVLPWATLVTPNRDELQALCGAPGEGETDEGLRADMLMESGAQAVLVTGGDTTEDHCLDILYESGGSSSEFPHPRIGKRAPRGTGCALSSAVAAHLGQGLSMGESIRRSIDYVTGRIAAAAMVGNQLLLFPGKSRDL